MLIDREKIKEAKEKLGDANADIIADLLKPNKWDANKKHACCPFHAEDTPSFVYNSKGYYFKCFGCGKTIDIIDAYIETGKTYLEACDELFKAAGINYNINEIGVQTKREYKYPTPEPINDKSMVTSYLKMRGISRKTIDDVDVREDNHGNIVFNFYDTNGVLTMVKYRPSHKIGEVVDANGVKKKEIKSWCQKGADTSPILFHMDKVNTEQPLYITEGEIDCLSLIEAGITNSVSVPLGCQNLHWIEENFEWLEQFDSIIICGDNDEPGQKMRKEVISRLGSWRCKYVEIPETVVDGNGKSWHLKDANGILTVMGKDYLRSLVLSACDAGVPSVVDVGDVEDTDITDIDGIEFGISEMDRNLMRLFYGTVTLVSGKPGSGKTSLLSQLFCQAVQQGITPFMFSKEMPNYLQKNWIYDIMAGPAYMERNVTASGAEYYKIPKPIRTKIAETYAKRWFLYKDDEPNKKESLFASMVDCRRKYGCRLFIIDNLMMVDIGGGSDDAMQKQTDFMNELIDFAVKWQAAVVLVAHPRKMPAGEDVGMYDISGTANLINLAHRSIGLRRVNGEKEQSDFNAKATIIKDRIFGRSNIDIGMYYDVASRRFYSNDKELNFRYEWDKEEHKDVANPHINPNNMVYGNVEEPF